MHVADGQLSGPVLAAGAVVAGGGVIQSLANLEDRAIPRVAVMASVFFGVSVWHLPLFMPGTSIHLVLAGLMGLVLGRHVFLAAAIVLALQALMFGHGGITALGVNVTALALPALIMASCCKAGMLGRSASFQGALLGGGAVVLASLIVAACYALSDRQYWSFLPAYFASQIPLVILESVVTASAVAVLRRGRPDLLPSSLEPRPQEIINGS